MFENILVLLAGLIAAFATQVYLIKRLVAFVKKQSGWKGNALRWTSFGIGVVLGSLFLWFFVDTAGIVLPLSGYTLIGTLFILTAGLVASGDYDLKAAVDVSRVLLLRPPERSVISAPDVAISSTHTMSDEGGVG